MDRVLLTDPVWKSGVTQKRPIPVTRLNGEVFWIDPSKPNDPDDAVLTPEDERRITEITLYARSDLRSELELVFGGPDWPLASASLDALKKYAIKVYDVNADAYQKAIAAEEKQPKEALHAMLRNLLTNVFGVEWEKTPGDEVVRTDWQCGVEGWKGTEVLTIAGNDPDQNCLYHQVIADAIKYRYRFHAPLPSAVPGEPPGLGVSNVEWWKYIGLSERHNLAMAIKPYLEDREEHWLFAYTSSNESLGKRVTNKEEGAEINKIAADGMPKAFISYSWETEEHKTWVLGLAERLRSQGVDVILDHWHLKTGGDRTQFMESSISVCQFVVIICTPTYAQKANERHGGVGYEAMIITSELAKDILHDKFIPVLRFGEFGDSAIPKWLQSKIGVDLRGNPYNEQQYDQLLRALHRTQPVAPPVGPKPEFSTGVAPRVSATRNVESELLKRDAAKARTRSGQQIKRKKRDDGTRTSNAVPASERIAAAPKRNPKDGRSGIADNFLLGNRNAWVALLEECWPEIGWPLLRARDSRSISIDDLCGIFEPVKKKPHNPGLAVSLYRPTFQIANPSEVLKTGQRINELNLEIIRIEAEYNEFQRLSREAEDALKIADAANMERIEQEAKKRKQRLIGLQENLQQLKNEQGSLDCKIQDQRAYVFRFQLCDFLVSGQLEVTPRMLANALAGLPTMPWRESTDRCSHMPFDAPRLEYCIWELISEVWSHRTTDFEVSPVDFFKDRVSKLDDKWVTTVSFCGIGGGT